MKLEQSYIEQVRDAIDNTVKNSGYPVVGTVLEVSGIANRKKLRILESRGHIKSVMVRVNNSRMSKGTQYVAYYTEREVPKWIQEQEAKRAQELEAKQAQKQVMPPSAGVLLASAMSVTEAYTETRTP